MRKQCKVLQHVKSLEVITLILTKRKAEEAENSDYS